MADLVAARDAQDLSRGKAAKLLGSVLPMFHRHRGGFYSSALGLCLEFSSMRSIGSS